jgi:hypothetical protein
MARLARTLVTAGGSQPIPVAAPKPRTRRKAPRPAAAPSPTVPTAQPASTPTVKPGSGQAWAVNVLRGLIGVEYKAVANGRFVSVRLLWVISVQHRMVA